MEVTSSTHTNSTTKRLNGGRHIQSPQIPTHAFKCPQTHLDGRFRPYQSFKAGRFEGLGKPVHTDRRATLGHPLGCRRVVFQDHMLTRMESLYRSWSEAGNTIDLCASDDTDATGTLTALLKVLLKDCSDSACNLNEEDCNLPLKLGASPSSVVLSHSNCCLSLFNFHLDINTSHSPLLLSFLPSSKSCVDVLKIHKGGFPISAPERHRKHHYHRKHSAFSITDRGGRGGGRSRGGRHQSRISDRQRQQLNMAASRAKSASQGSLGRGGSQGADDTLAPAALSPRASSVHYSRCSIARARGPPPSTPPREFTPEKLQQVVHTISECRGIRRIKRFCTYSTTRERFKIMSLSLLPSDNAHYHGFQFFTVRTVLHIAPLNQLGEEQKADLEGPIASMQASQLAKADEPNLSGSSSRLLCTFAIDELHYVEEWKAFRVHFAQLYTLGLGLRTDTASFGCIATMSTPTPEILLLEAGSSIVDDELYMTEIFRSTIDEPNTTCVLQNIAFREKGKEECTYLYFLLNDAVSDTGEATPASISKTLVFSRSKFRDIVDLFRFWLIGKTKDCPDPAKRCINAPGGHDVHEVVPSYTSYVPQHDMDLPYSGFAKLDPVPGSENLVISSPALGSWFHDPKPRSPELSRRLGRGGREIEHCEALVFLSGWVANNTNKNPPHATVEKTFVPLSNRRQREMEKQRRCRGELLCLMLPHVPMARTALRHAENPEENVNDLGHQRFGDHESEFEENDAPDPGKKSKKGASELSASLCQIQYAADEQGGNNACCRKEINKYMGEADSQHDIPKPPAYKKKSGWIHAYLVAQSQPKHLRLILAQHWLFHTWRNRLESRLIGSCIMANAATSLLWKICDVAEAQLISFRLQSLSSMLLSLTIQTAAGDHEQDTVVASIVAQMNQIVAEAYERDAAYKELMRKQGEKRQKGIEDAATAGHGGAAPAQGEDEDGAGSEPPELTREQRRQKYTQTKKTRGRTRNTNRPGAPRSCGTTSGSANIPSTASASASQGRLSPKEQKQYIDEAVGELRTGSETFIVAAGAQAENIRDGAAFNSGLVSRGSERVDSSERVTSSQRAVEIGRSRREEKDSRSLALTSRGSSGSSRASTDYGNAFDDDVCVDGADEIGQSAMCCRENVVVMKLRSHACVKVKSRGACSRQSDVGLPRKPEGFAGFDISIHLFHLPFPSTFSIHFFCLPFLSTFPIHLSHPPFPSTFSVYFFRLPHPPFLSTFSFHHPCAA
ncbi:uncharacterized protein MYCFIDRAFT_180060 [Pseudocercospora fijiensis CIRAD86]|uniref:Uncharacterized protein n=1 Tax=Pseudocercospora fijiensis (strain CIRAD86) TaxID=383855 RepID=M3AJ21_PSEFD|nr:uncharacterized protein MYCFIDRAFT_180060 [Pseudocercospora fijiensis CIRAD86]EME77183.1 hypothetical protein MYCFIDRAFT_180060 [Pseudocercospora fijiensis CIRAD86]